MPEFEQADDKYTSEEMHSQALAKILEAANNVTEAAGLMIRATHLRLDEIERGVIEEPAKQG